MTFNAMGLIIPTPSITSGPEYATQVSDDLERISTHTHTGSSNDDGYQIPSAGLNINADLSMQFHNLISLRSVRFANQDLVLSGIADVGCAYEKSGDLWYNNAAGIPIQLTSGNAIFFTNVLNYALLLITSNHTINSFDTLTVLECDCTSNTIIVTLPVISSVPAGRFYIIKDFKGTSENFAITINPSGTNKIDQLSAYTIADNHAAIGVVSDGIGNWSLYQYDRKVYSTGEIIKLNGAEISGNATSNITSDGYLTINGESTFANAIISSLTVNNTATMVGITTFNNNVVYDKSDNNFIISSSNVTGSNNSDSCKILTGNAINGVAGQIVFQTGGVAGAGAAGDISLITGSSSGGQSGNILFQTGNGVAAGSIFLTVGTTASSIANGIGLFSTSTSTAQFKGGIQVVFLADALAVPGSNPVGGILLYSNAGELWARTATGLHQLTP